MQLFEHTYEIFIFDDNSTDRSVDLIEDFIKRHPESSMTLIRNSKAVGLAQNFINAAIVGKGKYLKLVTGCNYEPKEAIQLAIKNLGTADVVLLYFDDKRGFFKEKVSALYTKIVNLLSGYSIHYYHNVSLILREDMLRYHPSGNGYGFLAEFVTILLNAGKSCNEVYTPYWNLPAGHSSNSLRIRNFLPVFHSLMNILLNRIENKL
jgi:glycosyltransferase involved in cell wall biosynthesis